MMAVFFAAARRLAHGVFVLAAAMLLVMVLMVMMMSVFVFGGSMVFVGAMLVAEIPGRTHFVMLTPPIAVGAASSLLFCRVIAVARHQQKRFVFDVRGGVVERECTVVAEQGSELPAAARGQRIHDGALLPGGARRSFERHGGTRIVSPSSTAARGGRFRLVDGR